MPMILSLMLVSGCQQVPVYESGHVQFPNAMHYRPPDDKILRFGIVPQQGPSDIELNWGPLVDYIESHSDYTVHIKTASSIPEFERRVKEGRYDIAYMNPYHYVLFSQDPGYQAFAKQKDKVIKGILVVRKDSPYEDLSDFQDQEAAFPSPLAFAASLLTRAEFKKRSIDIEPVYVRSHDSVYAGVASGLHPVGGGVKRTFGTTDPDVQAQLKILWTTAPYTPHAFAAHPNLSESTVQELQQILESINTHSDKETILTPINFKGFEAANDKSWDDVRALHLDDL